jgi:hypothetical protein
VYIFDPLKVILTARKSTVDRVYRWAWDAAIPFSVHHLPGVRNLWVNMLWRAPNMGCALICTSLAQSIGI